MRCVSSVRFAFNINGSVRGSLIPERGLRQGDPLSPFLFLFCAEGLSRLLMEKERRGLINGVRFGRGNLRVSHLLFADDSLIFFRASVDECEEVGRCLATYASASRQSVNFSKSDVCFGHSVPEATKTLVAGSLGVAITECHKKYLGLPTFSGRKKCELFAFIRERVWKKLNSWRGLWFSHAGREVLVKAVLQAIPGYVASCFQLPKTLIKDIHQIIAKFWWGTKENEKKIHWCKWEELTVHKEEWGLGFRDLERFNQALIAKHVWRLERNRGSLVEKVFRTSYFPNGNILEATCNSNGSSLWRSLMWGKKLIVSGSRWRIGNGETVMVMKDRWIPRSHNPVLSDAYLIPDNMRVAELKHNGGEWNEALVRAMFDDEDAKDILAIPVSEEGTQDKLRWHFSPDGEYTVKSGYRVALTSLARPSSSAPGTTGKW